MKIREIPCEVFDIEVFINCFHCTTYNTETNELTKFEVSSRKNEIQKLIDHFTKSNAVFIGYNNIHYDNPIINYCIEFFNESKHNAMTITSSIFGLSSTITNKNSDLNVWKKWKYAKNFKTIDLLTMLYSQALRVSLKEMQVTMMYKNVQEFVTNWDEPIQTDKIDSMIEYNINDVLSTTELLNRCKADIELRIAIEDEYNIQCMSKDGVNIGMDILKHKYLEKKGLRWDDIKDLRSPCDKIALKDVIIPYVNFRHPTLKKMLETMRNSIVSPGRKGFEYKFVYGNLEYSVGVGGIHSVNRPGIIKPKEDEILCDKDVASLYPSMLLQYDFYPKHLGKEFKEVYANIREERIDAKHKGIKTKDATLKLALNGLSGNLQNEFSWVYSPYAVMQIRINGQLLLMMLAERLTEIGVQIIQANTDGLFMLYKKSLEPEVDKLCAKWENLTRLQLETDYFDAMYQYAINDYFAVQSNGKIKEKGMFITSVKLGKGLTPKIIPKAIQAYFLKGTPVMDFLTQSTDIKDFIMSEKTGKQWHVEYLNTEQQRINRFYASTNGGYLWKWKYKDSSFNIGETETRGEKQYQNMLASSGVTLLNKFDDTPIHERKINYRYYFAECIKIIEELKPRQLSLW